jgi:hypothetical protein
VKTSSLCRRVDRRSVQLGRDKIQGMSKRLNKRQQREQEELAQLQAATPTAAEQQSESSDNEEQVQSPQPPSAANLFAAVRTSQFID